MSADEVKFTEDFPAVSYEAWVSEVEKALKGAPFDKKMLTRTYEGITLKPVYTRDSWSADGDPSGYPGATPFTRGSSASRPAVGGWDIRQEHADPDVKAANATIRADLQRGATSVTLVLDAAGKAGLDGDTAEAAGLAGLDGMMLYSVDDLDDVFDDVLVDLVPVALDAGGQFLAAAGLLQALWQRRGVAAADAKGAFNADPLGALARTGSLPVPAETALKQLAGLAAHTAATYPNVTAVGVDTGAYHAAGADEATDLGCMLATGVAYLRAMTEAGMGIDQACRQILFTVPTTCDQFLSIAKLRAARRLWARVAEACGASEPARAARVHARSADRMMTKRDPWVNMLRTTVAGFAAATAGADHVTLLPFDAALGVTDDFARRVARNTQIVLMEESHLGQVIDPAGGSWYVESRTDELADAAWRAFQAIEEGGGMLAVLRDGSLAKRIAEAYAGRAKNLARRRDPITGVSEFPNVAEAPVPRTVYGSVALRGSVASRLAEARGTADVSGIAVAAAPEALAAAVAAAAAGGATLGAMAKVLAGDGENIAPLPRHRLAEAFEDLRDASDRVLAETGKRPQIFLANLGPIAKHTARATFAKNFFGVAGIESVDNQGFKDVEACVAAFKASGARIAILCSADPLYETMVESFAPALKSAGCVKLFMAGAPGDKKDQYMAAGVDDFIFLGGDVLEITRETLRLLGAVS